MLPQDKSPNNVYLSSQRPVGGPKKKEKRKKTKMAGAISKTDVLYDI